MAYEIPGKTYTLPAGLDLSGYQFCGVVDSATGAVLPTLGSAIDGVVQNKPNALGKSTTVMKNGLTKMVASAAIAIGADLAVTATGQAITAVATNRRIGRALTAAAGAGEVITVALAGDGTA